VSEAAMASKSSSLGKILPSSGKALFILIMGVEDGPGGTISFDSRCFETFANSSFRNNSADQARMIKNFNAALEFQGLKGLP
jgi:hypothetical protein